MVNLAGKIALVTGATRGLGKGVAMGLGEAGATVYITGRSTQLSAPEASTEVDLDLPENLLQNLPGTLADTALAVEQAGGRCIPVQVDHAQDQQVEALFAQIRSEQAGQLDLLVNNAFAGVQALRQAYGQPFWQADPQLWDACHQVGARSHYLASRLAAELMVPRQQGLICTLSSWGGLSYIFGVAYGAGKAACDRLAADMAIELKPSNIASVSLWPGIVATEQMQAMAAENSRNSALLRDGYNWEQPLLTGRAIAALAADPQVMRRSGRVQIVAELAQQYGLVDLDGNRPASLRSLKFLLPSALPALKPYQHFIPDCKIPWSLLLLYGLRSPQV